MFDKETEAKNESSNRRRFFRKLVGLAALAGIGGASLAGSTRKVYAADTDNLKIGMANSGSSVTSLTASPNYDAAFQVETKSTTISGAIIGFASGSTGATYGVGGASNSVIGYGVLGSASASTGSNIGVYGESWSVSGYGVYGTANGGIGVLGQTASPNGKPIVALGTSGQTASLQEWQATSGTASACIDATGSVATTNVLGFLSVQQTGTPYGVYMSAPAWQCMGLYTNTLERVRIDSNGNVGIGTTTPNTPIHVQSSSSNPAIKIINENNHVGEFIYCYSENNIPFFSGRRARGTIALPNAVDTDDTLMRYGGSGYGQSGFPGGNRAILEFRAAEKWTDSHQGTYITMQTTPTGSNAAAERMRITDAGEIVPPTDNTGSIGTASRRWSLVRATTVTSGDLAFENSFTVTEDEKVGLAFKNDAGEKIAVLDREGNFYVKGEVRKLGDL